MCEYNALNVLQELYQKVERLTSLPRH